MIIEAKGTKTNPSENENPHERYVLKNADRRSHAPLFFTVFLTGLAVYLKSAFPRLGDYADNSEERPPAPAGAAGTSAPEQVVARGPELVIDNEYPEERKHSGSGEALVSARRGSAFELADTPPISLQDLNLPSSALLRQFGGISVSFQAANDNAWMAQPARGIASSSGGGYGWAPEAFRHAFPDLDDDNEEPASDDADDENGKPVNRAPRTSGPVTLYDVYGCAGALIGLADLLRGAADPDGDPLSIRNLTISSGTLTQAGNGWTFAASGLGPVTLTYEITDGNLSVWQTAQFSVLRNLPIFGTPGDDILVGGDCADDIDARAGNDLIDARGGNDTVNGGDGDDHIVAGSGNDIVMAGAGADIVLGGLGDDTIWGGAGNDRLYGEDGRDTIFGEDGDDTISGGDGDDLMFGGLGNDNITGDLGNDRINGDDGNDILDGGLGNDVVLGNAGLDIVRGGEGNDLLGGGADADSVRGEAGNDTILGDADGANDSYDGGDGEDTLDYSAVTGAIEVDLAEGAASGGEIGNDAISNIEAVKGGGGDDTMGGSANDDTLSGGGGDDRLAGSSGADEVGGDAGNDVVIGDSDAADDRYDGGSGIDTLDYSVAIMAVAIDLAAGNATGAEIGTDTISNFETISAGAGDDTIAGSNGEETLLGNGGNDTLADGGGTDWVDGGHGDDRVVAAADGADDTYAGGEGTDTLDYSASAQAVLVNLETGEATGFDIGHDAISGFETVHGGSGDDRMIIGPEAMILRGGDGNDTFQFHIPEGSSSAEVIHNIIDFMVGDRIETSNYEIFEDVIDGLEDRFEDIYGETAGDEPLPIKIRHEGTGELAQTLIEVDMNRDEHFEMTINLSGHHVLMIVENP